MDFKILDSAAEYLFKDTAKSNEDLKKLKKLNIENNENLECSDIVENQDSEVSSSNLAFQVLIYYNFWFYIIWQVSMVFIVAWKSSWFGLGRVLNIINLILFVVFLVLEPVRLWWGYSGNLRESPPLLVGHLLLTCIVCLPICIWFVALQTLLKYGFVLPLELAVNSLYILIAAPQLYYGYSAAKLMASKQTTILLQQLNNALSAPIDDKLAKSKLGSSNNKLYVTQRPTEQTSVMNEALVVPLGDSKKQL